MPTQTRSRPEGSRRVASDGVAAGRQSLHVLGARITSTSWYAALEQLAMKLFGRPALQKTRLGDPPQGPKASWRGACAER
jgi:hypothetical protein